MLGCTSQHPGHHAGVVQVRNRSLNLRSRLKPRQHHSRSARIEHSTGPYPRVGLHPHHCRNPVGRGHRHRRTNLVFPARAVLKVQQQPVESSSCTHLSRHRGRSPDERAHRDVTGGDPCP